MTLEDLMTLIHAVIGIIIFVIAVGVCGFLVADYLDKKYDTDDQ